jgi:hypothetical protein
MRLSSRRRRARGAPFASPAVLIRRLPPRSRRWRLVLPKVTVIGAMPPVRASLAPVAKRWAPAISPIVRAPPQARNGVPPLAAIGALSALPRVLHRVVGVCRTSEDAINEAVVSAGSEVSDERDKRSAVTEAHSLVRSARLPLPADLQGARDQRGKRPANRRPRAPPSRRRTTHGAGSRGTSRRGPGALDRAVATDDKRHCGAAAEQHFAATSPRGPCDPVWWCAATLALLIDVDVAGVFTDVLRALAGAARDRVSHRGPLSGHRRDGLYLDAARRGCTCMQQPNQHRR